MEDRNMKKVTMLSEDELDKIAGGLEGEYRFITDMDCPNCGKSNSIKSQCCSGQTKWRCYYCGRGFTICF